MIVANHSIDVPATNTEEAVNEVIAVVICVRD